MRYEIRPEIDRRWPTDAIPGRSNEERAAADAASIIAPNAEAMRIELAHQRDMMFLEQVTRFFGVPR